MAHAVSYNIVRFFADDREQEVIETGLTLEEAQEHCNDPSTRGEGWFDGYTEAERSFHKLEAGPQEAYTAKRRAWLS